MPGSDDGSLLITIANCDDFIFAISSQAKQPVKKLLPNVAFRIVEILIVFMILTPVCICQLLGGLASQHKQYNELPLLMLL